jgi:hypothetical protein
VLRTLQDHQLFLKKTKCEFGRPSVAYLAHVISEEGVAMGKLKVQAVLDWLVPHSARAVCGFLGLAGYYHRFIRDFAPSLPRSPLSSRRRAFIGTKT